MPLTKKGKTIRRKMTKTYGSKAKGDEVFYASANKGTITGVHGKKSKKKSKSRRGGKKCRKGRR